MGSIASETIHRSNKPSRAIIAAHEAYVFSAPQSIRVFDKIPVHTEILTADLSGRDRQKHLASQEKSVPLAIRRAPKRVEKHCQPASHSSCQSHLRICAPNFFSFGVYQSAVCPSDRTTQPGKALELLRRPGRIGRHAAASGARDTGSSRQGLRWILSALARLHCLLTTGSTNQRPP